MREMRIPVAVLARVAPLSSLPRNCALCDGLADIHLEPADCPQPHGAEPFDACTECAAEFLASIADMAEKELGAMGFILQVGSEPEGGVPPGPGAAR